MKTPFTLFALLAVTATCGHAAVIAEANFTGMTASGASSVAPVVGANDFTWNTASDNNITFSVVSDNGTPGIGGGNALAALPGGNFRGTLGTMTNTSLAVGETLRLNLDGRYTATPGDNSTGLRIGFVNSADPDNSFFAMLGTGTSNSFTLYSDTGTDNGALSGADTFELTGVASSGSTYSGLGTDPYNIVFSVKRTATSEYQIVADVNGAIRTATTTTGWDSYNQVGVRNGFIDTDFVIDNVSVSLIPEPSAALFGGLGLLAMLCRRRRAN